MPTISWTGTHAGSAAMGTGTPHAFGPGSYNVTVNVACIVTIFGSAAGMNGASGNQGGGNNGRGGNGAASNAAGFDIWMYPDRNYSCVVSGNVGFGGSGDTYLYEPNVGYLSHLSAHGVHAGSGVWAAGGGGPGTPGGAGGYNAGGCGGGGGGGANPFGDDPSNDGGPGGGGGNPGQPGAAGQGGAGFDEDGGTGGGGGGRGIQVPGSTYWYGGGGGGGGTGVSSQGAGGVGGTGVFAFRLAAQAQPSFAPVLNSIAPTSGWRGTDTYVNLYGSNFIVNGSTVEAYTNGGFSVVSGTVYGNSTNIGIYVRLTETALLGVNHLLRVNTAEGSSGWIGFSAGQLPPTITQVDNTTTGAANDSTFRPGTTSYTHVWGTQLTPGTYGTVSGTGVTAPYAAWGGNTLIALNVTVAADALPGSRTLTVTNEGGTSTTWPITIEALGATIGSITPAYGFQGTEIEVVFYGSNYVGSVTVQVGDGSQVSVTRTIVDAAWQIRTTFSIAPAAPPGVYNVVVTTPAGLTNAVPFEVLAAVVRADAGDVIIDQRNSAASGVGMAADIGIRFLVKNAPLPLNALGRYKVSGNAEPHLVTLRDSTAAIVTQAIVDFSSGGMGISVPAMDKAFTPSAPRPWDMPYWLGCRFITKASPVKVTGLGNYKRAGHVNPKNVVIATVASPSRIIASGTVYGGPDNEMSYVPIAPVTLAANTQYYLFAQMVFPDDCWDHVTGVTGDPRFITVEGSYYTVDNFATFGGALGGSYCYGPLSMQCEVSAGSGGVAGQWNYVRVPDVTLAANREYTLVSREYRSAQGHDTFLDSNTAVSPDPAVTIYAPTLNQSLALSATLGTVRLGGTYHTGCRITTGSFTNRVVALGRWKRTGNTRRHLVSLRHPTTGAILVSAYVDFGGGRGMNEEFVYADIPPFTVSANTTYDLVSDENVGDEFYDYDGTISPAGIGSIPSAVVHYYDTTIMPVGAANHCYGPVSLLYATDNTAQLEAGISHFSDPSPFLRSEFNGTLGTQFRSGAGITIYALGRWKHPGNIRAHPIVLRDAAGTILRSAVVDFSKGAGRNNEWFYVPIQPIDLGSDLVYYILSQETNGGDQWNNGDYVCTERAYVCNNLHAAWTDDGAPGAGILTDPMVGGNHVPVNFLWRTQQMPWQRPDAKSYVTVNARFQKWDTGQPMVIII